jgi:hypothetical protein
MSQGLSFESFAADLDVNTDTIHHWVNTKPSFSVAKKIGFSKLLKFYEKTGVAAMHGKIPGFNATAFVWMTKNMCKWRDKIDHNVDVSEEAKKSFAFKLDEVPVTVK